MEPGFFKFLGDAERDQKHVMGYLIMNFNHFFF